MKRFSTGPLENGAFNESARTHIVYVQLTNNHPLGPADATVTVWNLGVWPKAVMERHTVVVAPLGTETVSVTGLEGIERVEVQVEVADEAAGQLQVGAFGGDRDGPGIVPVPVQRLVSSECTPLQPSFTPADIPRLMACYDAEQLNLNEGEPVSVWAHGSGNGHDARQDAPRFQPN